MSNEYTVLRHETGSIQISEQSSRFSIDIEHANGVSMLNLIRELTPQDLAQLILKSSEVLSYFDDDLREKVGQAIVNGSYPYDKFLKEEGRKDVVYAVAHKEKTATGEWRMMAGPYPSRKLLEEHSFFSVVWTDGLTIKSYPSDLSYYVLELDRGHGETIVGYVK